MEDAVSLSPTAPENPWQSALVSSAFALWTAAATVLGFAVVDHATDSLPILWAWFSTHWLIVIVSLIINPAPWYRARQAILNAQKGVVS